MLNLRLQNSDNYCSSGICLRINEKGLETQSEIVWLWEDHLTTINGHLIEVNVACLIKLV